MRIGFIGAGRVGFTFGKYMKEHGLQVAGYYSRNPEDSKAASEFTGTLQFNNKEELVDSCDLVMLTVSDNAIASVWDEIKSYHGMDQKIVCHTSGSMSSNIFKDTPHQIYGYSIHPIYAVSDRYETYRKFSNAFITIEGHEKYLETLKHMIEDIGLKVAVINSDSKALYHASSVMASNLVCGLYEAATSLMTECGMTDSEAREALKNLFRDNALGIAEKGNVSQLTGPIERGDTSTIRRHLDALRAMEKIEEKSVKASNLKTIYKELSKQTLKIAKQKNPDRDYHEIEECIK